MLELLNIDANVDYDIANAHNISPILLANKDIE